MEDVDPTDQRSPNGICSRCRNSLLELDKGKPVALEDPVDFSTLNFPAVLIRRFGGVTELGDLQGCPCSICIIAWANPGQEGHSFGGQVKLGPFPVVRPPLTGPKRLATPKPIRICKHCRQVIGKGIPHPQPCGISERRENLQDSMHEDPRGAEMAASALLRQKNRCCSKRLFLHTVDYKRHANEYPHTWSSTSQEIPLSGTKCSDFRAPAFDVFEQYVAEAN